MSIHINFGIRPFKPQWRRWWDIGRVSSVGFMTPHLYIMVTWSRT